MRASLEFLLGLLDRDESACVASEDWDGEREVALCAWQEVGLIAKEPGVSQVASCPHCSEGVPFHACERLLCNLCGSEIDPDELLAWRLDLPAFLRWVAGQWRLRGPIRRIDSALWQLGTLHSSDGATECFYRRAVALSGEAMTRLSAFTRVIVVSGTALVDEKNHDRPLHIFLPQLVSTEPPLSLADPLSSVHRRREVVFDASTGTLRVGGSSLGEVPFGSKEFYFLRCLAERPDRFIAYADLKREILRLSGSHDTRDEAGFCQRLKSRIKQSFIPQIDRYVVTTNKGDGYRLRGETEPWSPG